MEKIVLKPAESRMNIYGSSFGEGGGQDDSAGRKNSYSRVMTLVIAPSQFYLPLQQQQQEGGGRAISIERENNFRFA